MNLNIPLKLWRPVRGGVRSGSHRPAGADAGLQFLLCPPRSLISIPFLLLGFPLQIGLHNREKVLGRPGRSGEGSRRRELDLPQRSWSFQLRRGHGRLPKAPHNPLISLQVQWSHRLDRSHINYQQEWSNRDIKFKDGFWSQTHSDNQK